MTHYVETKTFWFSVYFLFLLALFVYLLKVSIKRSSIFYKVAFVADANVCEKEELYTLSLKNGSLFWLCKTYGYQNSIKFAFLFVIEHNNWSLRYLA